MQEQEEQINSTIRVFIQSTAEKNKQIKGDTSIIIHSSAEFFPPMEYKDQLEQFFIKYFDFLGKTGELPEVSVQEVEETEET